MGCLRIRARARCRLRHSRRSSHGFLAVSQRFARELRPAAAGASSLMVGRRPSCSWRASGTTVVGTLTRATTRNAGDAWVVFPSAGAVRRIGPNRLWTRFARAWAARGVSSFRLDIRGVGDSGGPDASDEHFERLYSPEALNDVAVGIEHVRDNFGARRFAVVGLCSGGVAGFHVAVERDDVVGAVLINPPFLIWDRYASASAYWAAHGQPTRTTEAVAPTRDGTNAHQRCTWRSTIGMACSGSRGAAATVTWLSADQQTSPGQTTGMPS